MLRVRDAEPHDAIEISQLLGQLGYKASPDQVLEKLRLLTASPSDRVLVATHPDHLVGCIGLHTMELFHAPGRLGRITALVVADAARRVGVGSALVQAGEEHFRSCECVRAEVTSGDHRPEAHRFYEALGYTLDERRFLKRFAI